MGLINQVYNYLTGNASKGSTSYTGTSARKNLNSYPTPAALMRTRQDASTLLQAIKEAEQAWFPQRVRLQEVLNETARNLHVRSCMSRRKDLTLLRDFAVYDKEGNEIEDATEYFNSDWFDNFQNYVLDARFYGYQLIALGDLIDSEFPSLTIVKRENISPDRLQVTKYTHALDGVDFTKGEYKKWHIYINTPTDNAQSKCGLGLLAYCALPEIYLRNLAGDNATFLEMFAQPYRVGTTHKTEENERKELLAVLRDMGSSGYAVIDPTDEINFLETSLGGSGYNGYDNFERRNEGKISKSILGHANALDEQAGKLGASQGENNPVIKALRDIQIKDGVLVENVVNKELIPRMRVLGFGIPDGAKFIFKNDAEEEEYRERVDASNKLTADIALTMKQAGLQMGAKYFEERTGIPTSELEQAEGEELLTSYQATANIANMLNKSYRHICDENCSH